MSDGRRQGLARLVCGRRTKWLVVLLWVVVIAVAGPLAQKLTDAQNNDAASERGVGQDRPPHRPPAARRPCAVWVRAGPERGRAKAPESPESTSARQRRAADHIIGPPRFPDRRHTPAGDLSGR
ncbi:hypothetical protein [Streptomyces sp. H27-D2]|uniref:hypothetical protein n=1 Tax=Streptomyces sp. H27-D2 TaxID=3046304 RepID=UPI002DBCAC38|nr:hypothetical protein [Streptomyces sp. H27-D2]MEC4015533.1 hypothetical protein [Streptomyces sp. H27-D2]